MKKRKSHTVNDNDKSRREVDSNSISEGRSKKGEETFYSLFVNGKIHARSLAIPHVPGV